MTDLPDWAKDKAREWLMDSGRMAGPDGKVKRRYVTMKEQEASLAALLVEVADRNTRAAADGTAQAVLAEVRRVVEGVRDEGYFRSTCDEILARLERL